MRFSVLISFVRFYISIKIGFNILILVVILVILRWFKDVRRERDLLIEHRGINHVFFKTGMLLFISSEVILINLSHVSRL